MKRQEDVTISGTDGTFSDTCLTTLVWLITIGDFRVRELSVCPHSPVPGFVPGFNIRKRPVCPQFPLKTNLDSRALLAEKRETSRLSRVSVPGFPGFGMVCTFRNEVQVEDF